MCFVGVIDYNQDMFIVSINKGRTITDVHVSGIASDRPVSNDVIAGFAMQGAGENPSSLFGWTVKTYGEPVSGAVVTLHTD